MGLALQDTARRAWKTAVRPSRPIRSQWTTASLIWTVLDIVVKTGAIGLAGEPLSHDARWLTAVKLLPTTASIGRYRVLLSRLFAVPVDELACPPHCRASCAGLSGQEVRQGQKNSHICQLTDTVI
jgi:hypothetical protein